MKIFPYWAKAAQVGPGVKRPEERYEAWGWSRTSEAEAQAMAEERARRAFERRLDWEALRREYDYLDVPLREEIVDELRVDDNVVAAITRNRYGALVLNTATVCFVDMDHPVRFPRLWERLVMVFSREARERFTRQCAQDRVAAEARVVDWATQHGHAARLYRTAAGLRLLLTGKHYDPKSEEVAAIFESLGADRLYRRLTTHQESFRARLTPKPWRCGCERPPGRWPREDVVAQQFAQWLRKYEQACRPWQTCVLVDTAGAFPTDPQIALVVQVHDQCACQGDALPLA